MARLPQASSATFVCASPIWLQHISRSRPVTTGPPATPVRTMLATRLPGSQTHATATTPRGSGTKICTNQVQTPSNCPKVEKDFMLVAVSGSFGVRMQDLDRRMPVYCQERKCMSSGRITPISMLLRAASLTSSLSMVSLPFTMASARSTNCPSESPRYS